MPLMKEAGEEAAGAGGADPVITADDDDDGVQDIVDLAGALGLEAPPFAEAKKDGKVGKDAESGAGQNEETDETGESESGESESDNLEDEGDEDGKGKLPPEVQEAVDRRIGKEVGKRKEAEEALAQATSREEALTKNLEQLRGQLAQADAAAAKAAGLPEIFLADDVKTLDAREAQIREFRAWAKQHEESGYFENPDQDEPTFTAEAIRARREELEDELLEIPKARMQLEMRQRYDEVIKRDYPELLDDKSDEFKVMVNALRVVPQLRLIPSFKVLIGDMIAGQRLRESKGKSATNKPKKAPVMDRKPGATPSKSEMTKVKPTKNYAAAVKGASGDVDSVAKALELMEV
jgi:hypothetical protein